MDPAKRQLDPHICKAKGPVRKDGAFLLRIRPEQRLPEFNRAARELPLPPTFAVFQATL